MFPYNIHMHTQYWLKTVLKGRGYRLKDVAELLGITPSRVTDILKGTRDIQLDEILPLAEMLDMTAHSLLLSLRSGRLEKVSVKDAPDSQLPLLGQLTGHGRLLPLPADLPFTTVPVPPDIRLHQGLYGYMMGDDSLHREIPRGSVIIAADPYLHAFPVVSGTIVIIRHKDSLFIRQFWQREGGAEWLLALPRYPDPALPPLRFSEQGGPAADGETDAKTPLDRDESGKKGGQHKTGGHGANEDHAVQPEDIIIGPVIAGVVWIFRRHMGPA
ncbi:helix-turn-helix domain-containing protein [Eilatimonas milleporae]|uniref:SOS-response transcriptional repressor LexA n=1 Tax=Eilatimonas milleporae TaxID=911205 RepID=A0A3M0CS96_9PROT|nr:helix-turn-helix transcriptional regulator [Eilatimonas milleporae]RMB12474.1 SOS-response transcriptional repressor LexA [Eilatimonas milleporae]